jgi:hypothetical protein
MSYAATISNVAFKSPGDWDREFWASYHDGFLPILQQTHGMWVMRNALRRMGTLTSQFEVAPPPLPDD